MKSLEMSKRFLLAGFLLVGVVCVAHATESLEADLEVLVGQVLDERVAHQPVSEDSGPSSTILAAARLARAAGEPSPDQPARQRDYIAALIACGLRDRARALLATYPVDTQDPVVARLRYALAEAYFDQGRLTDVTDLLPRTPSSELGLHLRWTVLAGRLMLAQQRPREAAERMSAFLVGDPVSLLSMDEKDALLLNILRYNLALGLIRAGDFERGRSLLDWLGSRTAGSQELVALRDRANLSLGDLLLDEAQGATAREAYLRIGSEGAAADRALLGLGWASLADAGKVHLRRALKGGDPALRATPDFVLKALRRRELIDCRTYNRLPHAAGEPCTASARIASSDAGSDETQRLRSAVLAWRWLIGRGPDSPAAREAALASAPVLARLGESSKAVVILQTLADQLAVDRESLRAAIVSIEGGRLLPADGTFTLEGLTDVLTPGQRMKLVADSEFMRAWTASSEARSLAGMAFDPALAMELGQLSDRFLERAQHVAIEHLQTEDRLRLQFQQATRKSLSSLLDPS